MLIDPATLTADFPRLEEIEKASTRFVTQAMLNFREEAAQIYQNERDKPQDIGEDITREALDRLGVSKIDQRLFGKMDYKRARYVFHPDYAIRQALFVDSKAEDLTGRGTATLQTAQTSLRIMHFRRGAAVDEQGTLPAILNLAGHQYLTTTIFVKYNYQPLSAEQFRLEDITVACVPNAMLQANYNPNANTTIWRAGRNAPTRGEPFRVRLVFALLQARARWRVQNIPMPPANFTWQE
ncbi:MAG TPA: SfiI family type II restriction endonuclease [Pyrinomonadaceae bacterium]|nr:SfiI family type II restriction endonuclease [Pyrinomonadaceae bacterium]